VVHEAVLHGGLGAEISARIQETAFDWLDALVCRVGARFAPELAILVLEDALSPMPGQLLQA